MTPPKILFFKANPHSDLNLDDEIKQIQITLADRHLSEIKLVHEPATRFRDLIDLVRHHRPTVVHFSGHGISTKGKAPAKRRRASRDLIPQDNEGEGGILVIGKDNRPKTVDGSELVELFKPYTGHLRIVVLNACHTESQAKVIADHIECVVGTTRAIEDEAACLFPVGFYRSLAQGCSVSQAFKDAQAEVRVEIKKHQASIFQLLMKSGVEADDLVLFSKTKSPASGSTTTGINRQVEVPTKAISSRLARLIECKVRDEDDVEFSALELLTGELGCDAKADGKSHSDHVADFLTSRRDIADIMSLARAYQRLGKQGKSQDAKRIGEIANLMLPLCLHKELLQEKWRELRTQDVAFIGSPVTNRTGAEILHALLHDEAARFKKSPTELVGEKLVPYEPDPIGDPDWTDSALSELYVATFHAEVKEDQRRDFALKLAVSSDVMKEKLIGKYRALRDKDKRLGKERGRPCYCVVKLAEHQADRSNQAKRLNALGIPDLLFIGLARAGVNQFEEFVIECLSMMSDLDQKGITV